MTYRNLVQLQQRQAEILGPRPAVRYRRDGLFHDLSFAAYRADALACASALVEAGIQAGDRVGLLSENRVEWLVADLGLMTAAAVNVPPHAPLAARQIQFQLLDSQTRWLFVSSRAQLEKMLPLLPELPHLKGLVILERDPAAVALAEDQLHSLSAYPLLIHSWDGFLARGRQALPRTAGELARREAELGPDALATIMYTSGTTGNPKGVMLSHGNLLANVYSVLQAQPAAPDDIQLSWLPYSHIYARTMDHYRCLAAGILMPLAESADTVIGDLQETCPTHMNSVPRLYEKVLASVQGSEPGEQARRLRQVFGPRLESLCSGGAPLPLAVASAYHAAGLLLLQGYGLTESSPVISFNRTTRYKLDTVGPPLPGVEVKIGPDGEVLTRGPHVMKGYWNNAPATQEAIRDGWLHTGDLGSLDSDGFLKITGRKKELLVLSNGKKVVPSQIEGLLVADACIDQAVVHGEGKNFLTALIVPHWANVAQALQTEGVTLDGQSVEACCRHSAVEGLLWRRIEAALGDVASWERVKKFALLPRPFTVAADELTVSLKLRRNVVLQRYREALEALYRE